MLLALAVSALPVAAAPQDDFFARATGWVLAGETLPPDYLQQPAAMPPDDRLTAVVFLRRSGLLDGAPTMLAPPTGDAGAGAGQ